MSISKKGVAPLNVLDLFCGCGGISLGFKLAGFNIAGGIDFNSDSVKTFQHNFPNSKAICCDLLEYTDERIKNDFGKLKIDVVVGGPPCQGFSSANRWQKESEDPRNKLFFEYLRFVKILRPKIVLIENVRGILSRDNGYAKSRIVGLLKKLNYNVSFKVLNASDFGVPQNRLRAFFVATNNENNLSEFNFESLQTIKKVTVKEAIGELYKFEKQPELNGTTKRILEKPKTEFQKYLRNKESEIFNHEIIYPAEITQKRIKCVPQGGNWQDIPIEMFSNARNNRHSSAFKRLDEKSQSVTIDTGNAHSNYFHPLYHRIPTVRESARIQSFYDSFIFLGTRTSQYRQIGNAVPPLLAKAIAKEIKKKLSNENN